MLRQLLSSHDNCQGLVIYPYNINHAPSVVIVSWQRAEHGNISLRCKPCSVSCHHLVTTVRAWLYIPKVWTMLRQLLSSSDNGQSMDISLRYEPWSVSCYRLMTTVRAWLFIPKVWTMLRQLLSSSDNGQTMVIYLWGMNHPPSVVIIYWHLSEHGNISLRYEPCSVTCYRLVTTVRAW